MSQLLSEKLKGTSHHARLLEDANARWQKTVSEQHTLYQQLDDQLKASNREIARKNEQLTEMLVRNGEWVNRFHAYDKSMEQATEWWRSCPDPEGRDRNEILPDYKQMIAELVECADAKDTKLKGLLREVFDLTGIERVMPYTLHARILAALGTIEEEETGVIRTIEVNLDSIPSHLREAVTDALAKGVGHFSIGIAVKPSEPDDNMNKETKDAQG